MSRWPSVLAVTLLSACRGPLRPGRSGAETSSSRCWSSPSRRPARRRPVPVASIFPTVGRYASPGTVPERRAPGGRGLNAAAASTAAAWPVEYPTGSYFVDARHAAGLAARRERWPSWARTPARSRGDRRDRRGAGNGPGLQRLHRPGPDLGPRHRADRPFVFRVCGSDVVMGPTSPPSPGRAAARGGRPSSTRWAAPTARSWPGASWSVPRSGRGREAAEFFYCRSRPTSAPSSGRCGLRARRALRARAPSPTPR